MGGIKLFSSARVESGEPAAGDPKPERFEIVNYSQFGPYIVVEIVWPDARNYEGKKTLVYQATIEQLRSAKALDPHFRQERGPLVPIARFEPTSRGWGLAEHTAAFLDEVTP